MESGSSGEDCHIKCTYQDCGLSFPTEKLMKRHKVGGHDFYCKKCDVDCEDYEKELHHRLTARSESGKRMHIACAVCGLKLKSMDGLDDHRRKVRTVLIRIRSHPLTRLRFIQFLRKLCVPGATSLFLRPVHI